MNHHVRIVNNFVLKTRQSRAIGCVRNNNFFNKNGGRGGRNRRGVLNRIMHVRSFRFIKYDIPYRKGKVIAALSESYVGNWRRNVFEILYICLSKMITLLYHLRLL